MYELLEINEDMATRFLQLKNLETGAGRSVLVMRMMEKGIHIECNAKVVSTTEDTITYEQNGVEHTITADTLIFG